MINIILHTMKKKEQMLKFINMLENVLESSLNEIKDGHHFDANSNECKECESFTICKEFHGMMKAINDSNFDENVKNDMAAFIIFMKKEYLFADDFNAEDILKSDDILSGYYRRFESVVKDFKNWDNLIKLLNDSQLSFIRKIIYDVVDKIEELMKTIINNNRIECNILIDKLRKPQQEEKSYEDMTKEELIEELKRR